MPSTNRLQRLCDAQHLDRAALALQLGVHERTVYRWIIGESGIPEKYWGRLGEIFGVSVAYVLGVDTDDNGNGNGNGVEVAA